MFSLDQQSVNENTLWFDYYRNRWKLYCCLKLVILHHAHPGELALEAIPSQWVAVAASSLHPEPPDLQGVEPVRLRFGVGWVRRVGQLEHTEARTQNNACFRGCHRVPVFVGLQTGRRPQGHATCGCRPPRAHPHDHPDRNPQLTLRMLKILHELCPEVQVQVQESQKNTEKTEKYN